MTTVADQRRQRKEDGAEGDTHLFVSVRGNRQVAKPFEVLETTRHIIKLNMESKGSFGNWRAQVDDILEFSGLVRQAKLREEVDNEAASRYAAAMAEKSAKR
jgi:hypothetical protein